MMTDDMLSDRRSIPFFRPTTHRLALSGMRSHLHPLADHAAIKLRKQFSVVIIIKVVYIYMYNSLDFLIINAFFLFFLRATLRVFFFCFTTFNFPSSFLLGMLLFSASIPLCLVFFLSLHLLFFLFSLFYTSLFSLPLFLSLNAISFPSYHNAHHPSTTVRWVWMDFHDLHFLFVCVFVYFSPFCLSNHLPLFFLLLSCFLLLHLGYARVMIDDL